MKMQLETGDYRRISSYGPGLLGIDGTDYTSNLLVTQSRVIENWFDGTPAELALEHFEPVLEPVEGEERAEILLLGTGAEHVFAPMRLLGAFAQRGIALEVMNTRAACRTYSVLLSESRPVAAALMQIER